MTKIAVTAAAILIATGTAFAGSDHYGSNNVNQPATPAASVDKTFTASIHHLITPRHYTKATTESGSNEYGQGIWGH